MKIVVCVKQVPDSWAEKKLLPADNTLDRESVDAVMNELDEYAIEESLKLVEANGGEVVVLSMGPGQAADTVRKALSMGATSGMHVVDPALHGSDAPATSLVLARAIASQAPDLVVFGCESTDARMSVVPAMVAERLGWPQLTFAMSVDVSGGNVQIKRLTEYGYDVVEAATPAVDVAALGLTPAEVGLAGSWTTVAEATPRPPKAKGVIVTDDGNGGVAVADFLSAQKFI
jgi:electron transfer flavoprotein beta subunit